jgi:hypothetical protein
VAQGEGPKFKPQYSKEKKKKKYSQRLASFEVTLLTKNFFKSL